MREKGRKRGNSGLKTVQFKLKGQDTIQVLLSLFSPPFLLSLTPAPSSSLGNGSWVRLGGGRAPVSKDREKKLGIPNKTKVSALPRPGSSGLAWELSVGTFSHRS